MDNLFFLNARCGKHKRDFYLRYDLGADDCWVLTYGLKDLPVGQNVTDSARFSVRDLRIGPQYRCAWCDNEAYVVCGNCGGITCLSPGSDSFHCAHCNTDGTISGTLSAEDMKSIKKVSGSGQ